MSGVLQLHMVSKRYGRVQALDAINLRVEAGSRLAIVGPSGSGKTTLLRMVAGFDTLDSGTVQLGETCLATPVSFVPAHLRDIGIVSQDGALFPHLSIAQNIGFGLPKDTPGRDKEIAQLLEMVGLEQQMLARKPDEISGGQQQRVALARALARRPRLMLLDEPFSALDTGLRASTRRAVADLLSARGITTVLVTHDQGEALSFADQVAVMRDGRILQAGDPRDLYLRPDSPFVAAFLGDALILEATIRDGQAQTRLGSIATATATAQRPAIIVLRPEQIVLQPGREGGEGCVARIAAVEFGGAGSLVTLELVGPFADGGPAVVLHRNGLADLRVGDIVNLSVVGAAHVFPAGD